MRIFVHPWSAIGLAAILALCSACRIIRTGGPTTGWQTHRTPDGTLAVQLPAGYEKRNEYGCWDRVEPRGDVWRDFCLQLLPPAKAEMHTLESPGCTLEQSGSTDCAYYEERRVDTVLFEGRPAVVERALLSGTIGHYRRRPAVLVRVPLGEAATAVLRGDHASEDADAGDELVAIAGTIRLARGS